MNVFKKENKVVSLFFVKAKTKEREESISCEVAAALASSNKGSFFSQDEWLQEIEEHECKPDTSEKQSDFAGISSRARENRKFKNLFSLVAMVWRHKPVL